MIYSRPTLEWRTDDEIDNQWHADVGGLCLQVDLNGTKTGYDWIVCWIDQEIHDRGFDCSSLKRAQVEAEDSARQSLWKALGQLEGLVTP